MTSIGHDELTVPYSRRVAVEAKRDVDAPTMLRLTRISANLRAAGHKNGPAGASTPVGPGLTPTHRRG